MIVVMLLEDVHLRGDLACVSPVVAQEDGLQFRHLPFREVLPVVDEVCARPRAAHLDLQDAQLLLIISYMELDFRDLEL